MALFSASAQPTPPLSEPIALSTLSGDSHAAVVLNRPGRYILTQHFRGQRGRHGIRILCDDVHLDLSGHTLVGCEFSRDGLTLADCVCNVRVSNGSIRSWGGVGADLCGAIRVKLENVKVFDNAAGALRLGPSAVLTDCVIGGDIRTGIDAMVDPS